MRPDPDFLMKKIFCRYLRSGYQLNLLFSLLSYQAYPGAQETGRIDRHSYKKTCLLTQKNTHTQLVTQTPIQTQPHTHSHSHTLTPTHT